MALFTVFCLCRYTCRFISFCTKQCEKGHRSNKPVTVTMPSHQDIHDLMLRQSSPYCERKSTIPSSASAPPDEEKGLLSPNRLTLPHHEGDNSSTHNYNTPKTDKFHRHQSTQAKFDVNAITTPVHQAKFTLSDLNISSSSKCDHNYTANNEISEVSLPDAKFLTNS